MSVYRKERRVSPVRLGLIGLVIVAVVIAGGLLLRSQTVQAPADPLASARGKALETAQGLDIFTVEYPQHSQGAERAGALDGLARARSAWEAAQADLAGIDGAAVTAISAGLAALSEQAQAGAPAEELVAQAGELQQAIFALIRASKPAQ